jgi:hypothetical protein
MYAYIYFIKLYFHMKKIILLFLLVSGLFLALPSNASSVQKISINYVVDDGHWDRVPIYDYDGEHVADLWLFVKDGKVTCSEIEYR